jgi:hypothetical protein
MEALAAFSDRLVLSLKVNRGRLGTACKLARRRQPQQPPLEGPPQQPVPRDSPLLCALDLAQASSADVFAELTGAFCNDTAPTRVQASRLVVEAARGRRLQHQLLLAWSFFNAVRVRLGVEVPRLAEGAGYRPTMSAGRADRDAVLLDILLICSRRGAAADRAGPSRAQELLAALGRLNAACEHELRYLLAKQQLVLLLLKLHSTSVEPGDAVALAQLITKAIDARPRLELDAPTRDGDAYRAEVHALRLVHTLVRRLVSVQRHTHSLVDLAALRPRVVSVVRRTLGTIDFELRVLSQEAALREQLELEVLLLTHALSVADATFGLFAPPLQGPGIGDGAHGLALRRMAASQQASDRLDIEISYLRRLAQALGGTRTSSSSAPALLHELGERRLLLATLDH